MARPALHTKAAREGGQPADGGAAGSPQRFCGDFAPGLRSERGAPHRVSQAGAAHEAQHSLRIQEAQQRPLRRKRHHLLHGDGERRSGVPSPHPFCRARRAERTVRHLRQLVHHFECRRRVLPIRLLSRLACRRSHPTGLPFRWDAHRSSPRRVDRAPFAPLRFPPRQEMENVEYHSLRAEEVKGEFFGGEGVTMYNV